MFQPQQYRESVEAIDFRTLYKKGFRGVLFDIDNTLVPHGADRDERATKILDELQKLGYRVGLISNNDAKRIRRFLKNLHLPFVAKAGKPRRNGFEALIQHLGLSKHQVLFVGDQLFTDIWGANRAGLYSILVQPIDLDEPLQIRCKRKLERWIMPKRRNK